MFWPPKPLGRVCAAVLAAQEVEAVGKRVGERVDTDVEGLGLELGPVQNAAFAGGWGHRPLDVEPRAGVVAQAHRLDATRGEPAAADREAATAALVLAKDADGALSVGGQNAPEALSARGPQGGHGLRVSWCDGAVGP